MEHLDIEKEITLGQENARRTYELYQLLSSYNAYSDLILKAKKEYKFKETYLQQAKPYSKCYRNQINDLFSLFKSDEYLKLSFLSALNKDSDMLFLIDENTLLRLKSYDIYNTNIIGLSRLDYEILKINRAIAKIYTEKVYFRDPYYCDKHWEEKEAFGIFENNSLVTPRYAYTGELEKYDNIDIREILKVQTIEEIYEKINEAKNIKAKTLTLKM